ncbi:hypothetical protein SDRG_02917 [Saprolegnia diclina VS20]|uniref:Uncharacterized protein n=1 Tax=Saprolegnia diclina (strain VS20) TaxID=1156394 RepID=T0QN45_SAPDV|nr:hypothetical protein SDRG_02917 [Saprolegnia diclina VS20]EQC39474.1 hypothetical protein SDRG_02917 [Saprolegnia diclina VS20]|eukprot:XP_008606746.1 hypothetical protein SDRG_02917 [Saprolegnia diclina VS20]
MQNRDWVPGASPCESGRPSLLSTLDTLRFEAPTMAPPPYLTALVQHQLVSVGRLYHILLVVFLGLLMAPFILIPLCITLRIDGHVAWSWLSTLTPLWVLDVYVLYACKLRLYVAVDDMSVDHACFMCRLPSVLLVIVGQLLVALRLDNVLGCTWSAALAPLVAAGALHCSPRGVLLSIQVVLIGLKLDAVLACTWTIVWLPCIIVISMGFVVGLVVLPMLTCFSVQHRDDRRSLSPVSMWGMCLVLTTLLTGAVAPFFLLLYRLEYADFPTIYLCVPYYVTLAIVVSWAAVDTLASTRADAIV